MRWTEAKQTIKDCQAELAAIKRQISRWDKEPRILWPPVTEDRADLGRPDSYVLLNKRFYDVSSPLLDKQEGRNLEEMGLNTVIPCMYLTQGHSHTQAYNCSLSLSLSPYVSVLDTVTWLFHSLDEPKTWVSRKTWLKVERTVMCVNEWDASIIH